MSDTIKVVDGPKREFSTGAESQDASGKGTPVLVPGDAILDIAKHFENGAALYGPRNWEKGIPLSEQLNSLERHLQQEKMGLTDEPHARALAWRAIVYLATKLRIEAGILPAELADMPVYDRKDRDYGLEHKGQETEAEYKGRPLKVGDKVKIAPRTKGNLAISEEAFENIRAANYVGTIIDKCPEGSALSFEVDIDVTGCGPYTFFLDELTLIKELICDTTSPTP